MSQGKTLIMYWLFIGYACRADKNPYRHGGRTDKNPYHIFTIKYILFTYVIQATISFTYQHCIS